MPRKPRPCTACGRMIQSGAEKCVRCYNAERGAHLDKLSKVLEQEALIPPPVPKRPNFIGSCVVVTDLHVPFHNPDVVMDFCRNADLLGIKTLVVGGDLIHADTISKYVGVGKQVPITTELESCKRVLDALLYVFDRIIVIPGNHDQRLERMIAGLADTKQGRQGLEMVARLLGAGDPEDAEDVALRYLRHFFSSPKVEWHPLPDLTINDTWLIQHPGTCSRVAPQGERAMARRHRKSVIQGHTHLWGIGFEESGTDVAFNAGHCADDSKWRYIREKPTTFPRSVHGYGIIYSTKDNPRGRLIPVAVHDRMFRIADIIEMAKGAA